MTPKKRSNWILFIALSFVFFSCQPDLPKYTMGDELYCIAKDGAFIRYDPNTRKRYSGKLKYGESVKFLETVEKIGIEYFKVNDTLKAGHWLKINAKDEIGYIFGGSLSHISPNSKQDKIPSDYDQPRPVGSTPDVDFYFAVTDVNLRKGRSIHTEHIDQIKEGTLVISKETRKGQMIKDCYLKSDDWINIYDGWASGNYFLYIYSGFKQKLRTAYKATKYDFDQDIYVARRKVNVRDTFNQHSTKIDYIAENEIVISDETIESNLVEDCIGESTEWIKLVDGGWASRLYFFRIPKRELRRLFQDP